MDTPNSIDKVKALVAALLSGGQQRPAAQSPPQMGGMAGRAQQTISGRQAQINKAVEDQGG